MSSLLLITKSEINSMYFFVYLMVSGTYYWVMCKNEKKSLSLFYVFCKALCSTMLALRDLYILVVYQVWEFITV